MQAEPWGGAGRPEWVMHSCSLGEGGVCVIRLRQVVSTPLGQQF